jgi:hypothetical protein
MRAGLFGGLRPALTPPPIMQIRIADADSRRIHAFLDQKRRRSLEPVGTLPPARPLGAPGRHSARAKHRVPQGAMSTKDAFWSPGCRRRRCPGRGSGVHDRPIIECRSPLDTAAPFDSGIAVRLRKLHRPRRVRPNAPQPSSTNPSSDGPSSAPGALPRLPQGRRGEAGRRSSHYPRPALQTSWQPRPPGDTQARQNRRHQNCS